VKIVDQDDPSKEVPVGEAGELAIAGPQVFSGYWGRADQDGVFTADGYVLTGDVATMDDDGYFFVVDRKKELIIAGGFNIYPSEVEEVLFRLAGVQDAVVIGVPDKYRGETVKAFVVRAPGSKLTEDDVVAHCQASLTAYKVPKLVEFRTELPRNTVGKVLRRVLVDEERARQAGETRPGSVPPGAPKATAAKKAPAKKAAPAKTAAAAKKAPAGNAPAKKAPAKKAPAKKA
jgi:long-chain acyl-CoA synthetase